MVTLAYGDLETPTLATVVFLSDQHGEDTKSVANALLSCSKNTPEQKPLFEWSTLKVQGNKTLTSKELSALMDAASQGRVGVGRVTPVKLS